MIEMHVLNKTGLKVDAVIVGPIRYALYRDDVFIYPFRDLRPFKHSELVTRSIVWHLHFAIDM